jgi:tetratricopeptide (TPR) repeat protein
MTGMTAYDAPVVNGFLVRDNGNGSTHPIDGGRMTPLRRARDERGWTKAKLVALIEQCARARNVKITTTQSLAREVSYWESGARSPQEPILGLLCAIYAKTALELGLNPTPDQARSDVGLIYSPSLAAAVDTLTRLAVFDAGRHTSVIQGAYSIDALNAACIDWLFNDSRYEVAGGRITEADVTQVRAATQLFDSLDRTIGGESQRLMAVQFVREKLTPRLAEAGDDPLSRELFTAASALCEVIGWMAYDAELHGVAQRYFVQALRLAKDADEPAYGPYVLTTMAHQALYLNRPDQALRFAQAARGNAHVSSVPIVATEATLLAAQAHARLGNMTDTRNLILEAESLFAQVTTMNTPTWASHWTNAVFATYVGSCWVDLGKPAEAYEPLRRAWDAAKDQPRRRVYSTGQLARVAALNHDIEQAASLGIAAVNTTSQQASQRSLHVIREVDEQLKRYTKQPHVREFRECARILLAG